MALVRILDAPEPFDAIVVEASGVSDPWRIAQIARADPTLILEAVSRSSSMPPRLAAQTSDPLLADTIARQLRAADWVLLNKIDLVDAAELEAARACVAVGAGGVARDRDDTGAPADRPGRRRSARPRGRLARRSLAARGRRGTRTDLRERRFRPQAPLSATALRRLLKAMPVGVLRLKGLLRTDEMEWAEIQFSGRHGSLRQALTAPADGQAAVVAIGLAGCLPLERLQEALQP